MGPSLPGVSDKGSSHFVGPSLPGVSDKGSSHFVGPSLPQSAVYFCCTGLGVASTGCYPAPCPVKPGLSSPAAFRHLQPRSPVRLIRNCNIPDLVCKDRSGLLKYYDYKWQEFFACRHIIQENYKILWFPCAE